MPLAATGDILYFRGIHIVVTHLIVSSYPEYSILNDPLCMRELYLLAHGFVLDLPNTRRLSLYK